MNIFRRNMLIANTSAEVGGGNDITYDKILGELPPESTKFEWPLYINLPFEEEYDRTNNVLYAYVKRDDIIIQQLANWLEENKVLVNDTGWGIKTYEVCPPELYINGLRVTNCSRDEDMYMDYDWMLSIVRPEHIANCMPECTLDFNGQFIELKVIIPK